MQAYATVARVGRPRMRLAFAGPVAHEFNGGLVAAALEDLEAVEDLAGEPAFARLRAHWRDWREDLAVAWRQTTFFLFDPDSWR